MPFPLEKLQYGLRRRLRELAYPTEASALQLAAPNYSGLQPIQKVKLTDEVEFYIDKESNLLLRREDTPMSLPKDDEVFRIMHGRRPDPPGRAHAPMAPCSDGPTPRWPHAPMRPRSPRSDARSTMMPCCCIMEESEKSSFVF
uniref:SHSP domain-containing protein n=1 Tax=Panagrellus redivivus TaxID=6233 RepID=A0A7E4W7W3_PANRE